MRLFVLLFMLVLPCQIAAQGLPGHTSTFVNDFADLLDPETEARLTALLKQVKQDRGVEMTVVTINSRNDYGQYDAIEPFATALFNAWGVGNPKRNDGIMVLVARDDRDMRIELGAGYPPVFDDRVKTVIDSFFIPWFQQGDFASGIEAGVKETIKRTRLDFTDSGYTTASRVRLEGENILRSATSGGLFAWIFGALALSGGGYLAILFRRWRRYRPRQCDLCRRNMELVSETEDDHWLNHGQQVEEKITSRDYDVWLCRHDDHVMIEGYSKWFSSFAACPRCGFRTKHSQRTVLSAATTSSTGEALVEHSCRNCDYRQSEHVTIPMIRESSSSSSSGGSFSGGSSSGGGASGSW